MKVAVLLLLLYFIQLYICESSDEWNDRINTKIDEVRKRNGKIKINPDDLGDNFKIEITLKRPSFPMGTAVRASKINDCLASGEDKYCAFIRENYNYIVLESKLKWSKWEPNYEDFQPELPDKAIAWARDLGMGVRGHCLFWAKNVSGHFPDWVVALRGEEMKKAIYHRLDTAVPHYDGLVEHWDVNNEMYHGQFFIDATGDPLIRVKMHQRAAQLSPKTKLFVNDYNTLLFSVKGEIKLVRDLIDNGAPVHGIGCQAHFGSHAINLTKVEQSLDMLWQEFHLPIWVTEFTFDNTFNDNYTTFADQLEKFYKLIMSHEGVGGILMWGFWDKAHYRPSSAIVNGDNFQVNKAGEAYIRLYHETFRTKAVIIPKLNKHGALVHFRGFQGEYTVTALLEDGSTKQLPNYKLE